MYLVKTLIPNKTYFAEFTPIKIFIRLCQSSFKTQQINY